MNLSFNSIVILSEVEQSSRRIKFGKINIITGENDSTGKSSILKSIYYAFGAEVRFEDEWLPLNATVLVRFSIDNEKYTIIRKNDRISILDNSKCILITTTSITKELSQFIGKMFNFELLLSLSGKTSESIQATPAFAFLPFYIDQDLGWNAYFSSFKRLAMFSRWQDAFKNYHSGIRPTEYYVAVCQIRTKADEAKVLIQEGSVIEKTKIVIATALEGGEAYDPVVLDELDSLLSKLNSFNISENTLRNEIFNLYELNNEIDEQLQSIASSRNSSLNELEQLKQSKQIICSRCGSVHESKIYHEYSLLTDVEDSFSAETQLIEIKKGNDERISNLTVELETIKNGLSSIRNEVQKVRQNESLNQTLNKFARERTDELFEIELNNNSKQIGEIHKQVDKLEAEQKKYKNKKRTHEIKEYYLGKLGKYFHDLAIDPGSISQYGKNFTPPETKMKTGSRAPRQMLAVYYAFISTAYKYSTCAKLPVVIDSPKQQEQDAWNASKIIQFCIANKPDYSQLIIATLNYEHETQGLNIITLNDKKRLLQSKSYRRHKIIFEFYQNLINRKVDACENISNNALPL